MGLLDSWRKRRAIRKLVQELPNLLAKGYGASDHYSVGQVQATLRSGKFGDSFHDYAFAFALSPEDALEHFDDSAHISRLRGEIGDLCFGGSREFSARRVDEPKERFEPEKNTWA